ncbi:ParA family protein [Bifidobacterium adolescentis]|nr:ParA family protein [Bifidobacterium adolescentis]KAB5903736.1 ParA family protein [Bifidobacterium adolescentis]
MDEAIKTADFVVIPTLSSPIDLQQTMLTAAQCQDAGKDYAVLIVMARDNVRIPAHFRFCSSLRC